jgi:hypothetical protein
MEKPIVFLSHSSRDEKPLKVLKGLLNKKTGGAISLFLSSDGQSIPLGRNWVHELQLSLDNSRLMFVFVSPDSLRSSWIHFEAGYAYSKRIKVVPVGIAGLDLGQVAPPLSLLQGFNVTSEAGLNNLIAVINKEFDHSHEETFTKHEYEMVFANVSPLKGSLSMSQFSGLIDSISVQVDIYASADAKPKADIQAILDVIEEHLQGNCIEYTMKANVITTYGLSAAVNDLDNYHPRRYRLVTYVSSELAGATLPIVGGFLSEVLGRSDHEVSVSVNLSGLIRLREGHHNITARLFGSSISLGPGEALQYKDVTFTLHYRVDSWDDSVGLGEPYVRITCEAGQVGSLDIEGLLETLFEREVLFIEHGDVT